MLNLVPESAFNLLDAFGDRFCRFGKPRVKLETARVIGPRGFSLGWLLAAGGLIYLIINVPSRSVNLDTVVDPRCHRTFQLVSACDLQWVNQVRYGSSSIFKRILSHFPIARTHNITSRFLFTPLCGCCSQALRQLSARPKGPAGNPPDAAPPLKKAERAPPSHDTNSVARDQDWLSSTVPRLQTMLQVVLPKASF